ncbi:hypothetical protein B0H10DRAFT_1862057 [Mycena sp. CBHHK59/15]|nr:hypothetical protein B0H10DRAFT_1862057 [Mycena sp. CBHHK59/15]
MAFRLCHRSKITAIPPFVETTKHHLHSGLVFRPRNYQPDRRDYKTYVAIRNQFLSTPRGRAALLYGGIVGHLTREAISNDEVMKGPSDDAPITGICLCNSSSMAASWDDQLTEEELDLICGVYHTATGEPFFILMTVSWWPKPPAFTLSRLNVGWWTPACESWYQKRVWQIEGFTTKLSTHADWKHNLKLERQCLTYSKAVEKCSAQILSVLCP